MMERNIPDVRDIFVRSSGDSGQKSKQELRCYEYSPRSRRRHEAMDSYESRISSQTHHSPDTRTGVANANNKKSHRHRADDFMEPSKQSKKADDHQKSSKSKDAAYYANRTLTERDIRHLERHLSMKKTIRKQISRNLAQAFVDDPDVVLSESSNPVSKTSSHKVVPDRTFTLTRAKVSKSEQNVLDLLKDNEPDSGHCSADNPNSSDDDSQEQIKHRHLGKNGEKNISCKTESRCKVDEKLRDDGKFSFWKMFSVKNKGRR